MISLQCCKSPQLTAASLTMQTHMAAMLPFTAFHPDSKACKESPAAVGNSPCHDLSKDGDGGLAQPQVNPDAVPQQLTEPCGASATAAAAAASAHTSAQTASTAGTDAAHTLRDSAVAVQLRVDRDDRTHVDLMVKAPPLAAAAAARQQPEALSVWDPLKAHGPKADAGLQPIPIQELEADLQAEKSGLIGLQVPKPNTVLGKPSSPSKAKRQIADSLAKSQPEAGPSRSLAEFAAAVFSSEPSHSEAADRPSAPGQLQSALVPSSSAVALRQPPKPLTEASSPPTRGKGPDPQLDPAAAYMLSGKPVPPQAAVASSVTGASSPPTGGKQSNTQLKSAAANLMPSFRLQGLTQLAAAESVTEQPGVAQPAATQPDLAVTKGFSAAAGQTVKAESAEKAVVDSVTTDRSAAVSEAAIGAASKGKQKQKRTDRQLDTSRQEAPEPKRAKKGSQAEAAAPEQPTQHQQQQAKPRSESQGRVRGTIKHPLPQPDPPAARQSPSHSVDLPACTLDSIFRSIRKLHLLGSGDRGTEQLSITHMSLLTPLLPLVQLRVLSKYATDVMPLGNVVKFFRKTIEVLGQRSHETRWLVWRERTSYCLCKAAADLCGQLGACGMLPEGALPTVTPQLLPFELQVPFVLCVGGYTGSMPLAEFAVDLLQALLSQVVLMLHKFRATADDCKTAQANLELARGSPSKLISPMAAPTSQRSPSYDSQAQHAPKTWVKRPAIPPAHGIPLSFRHVASAVFEGLVRINHLKDKKFDQLSYNFLQKQPPLWQVRIISQFAEFYNGGANSSAFLTSICKQNRDMLYREDYTWLTQHRKRDVGNSPELCSSAQALLDDACKAGVFLKGCIDPAVLAALPTGLHCIAVCYAISTAGTDSSTHSNNSAETFVAYAWDLIHERDPKADLRDGVQPSSRSRSQSSARAASQPPRDGSLDREAIRGRSAVPAAADQPSDAIQEPLGPSGPHRHNPSTPATLLGTHQGSHIQPSRPPHQAQSHGPQLASPPRHCCYFFSAAGCRTQNCPFYHGSHQEYVAYMAETGLVPYGLKFVSNVGRDKWIVDEAVDALNKLMLTKQLSRGSFNEHDLRPLAFLEDPNGDHSKLQLQVDLHNCCSS